ncbi:hypothetical protein KP509_26G018100 [Ceratopteris richardii]|uniref:Uncharacterized protein n=1 Tax=Ceratopteris richardii TaxID=49495 RepID=A0A8T2RIH0_CERRI|nr:hypothetical protein KP509_26G018100 [Ceratopteris richardii]
MMAHNDAEREAAHERKEAKEAEAKALKHERKAEHAHEAASFEKMMAHSDAEREAAHERKEVKEAEAKALKHERKAENAHEAASHSMDYDLEGVLIVM